MGSSRAHVVAYLGSDQTYRKAFRAVFVCDPASASVTETFANADKAIAAYERPLRPPETRFDRVVAARLADGKASGKTDAQLTAQAQSGLRLFLDDCGPLLTNQQFHNIGSGLSAEPDGPPDFGRLIGHQAFGFDEFRCGSPMSGTRDCPARDFAGRGNHGDRREGAFKVPSLRQVRRTAPYFHDGRYASRDQVLRHRNPPRGRHELQPLTHLSDRHLKDLEAFLATPDACADDPGSEPVILFEMFSRPGLLWLLCMCALLLAGCAAGPRQKAVGGECRSCHPNFHPRWAESRHAQAMQPFSAALAKKLAAQPGPIAIGDDSFLFRDGALHQNKGQRSLPLTYALGGKNIYYFLTPREGGRLQIAPLAYEVAQKRWYDVAASGVRPHATFSTPLTWTDPAFTFDASCYACHVSQTETNQEGASGIHCQDCHGRGDPHAKPRPHEQACLPCHAKTTRLSTTYNPAQRFLDHYNLTALEHADFYPDGRDRGDNHTYTGFLRSGCALSGQANCLTCHTSTGLFRYEATPNATCLPCHQETASQGEAHTHHAKGSAGSRCVGCHMPQTRIAAMRRSDHSMRPPTPAATIAYQSPNACNVCHANQTAPWADRQARAWYGERYQETALRHARWIDALRRQQWSALPQVLAYLREPAPEPVLAASLLRLLAAAPGAQVAETLTTALQHPHPLIRAAAAAARRTRSASE